MPRYSAKRRAALETTMQNEVFSVATTILKKDGVSGLTMDRIAREVGVSRGTLYNYFADADAVVNFVEARAFEPVLEQISQMRARAELPTQQLITMARTLLDALYTNKALAMAIFAKHETEGPRAEQKIEQRNQLLAVAEEIISSGVETGSLRPVHPHLAAQLFLGMLSGLIDSMIYSGDFKTADELVPSLADVLLHGLVQASEDTPAAHRPSTSHEPT